MNQRAKRRLALLVSLVVVATLLVIVAMIFADWNKQRRVEQSRAEGMAAFEKGDYAAALSPLSFAIANERDDIELALAFAETRIRNTDENGRHLIAAENLYKFALTLDPDSEQALNALFNIYVLTNQPLSALRVAERLPEGDIETHKKRAIAEIRIGEFDDALESVKLVRKIDPRNTFWPIREYRIRERGLEQSPEEMYELFLGYSEEFSDNQAVELVLIENMDRSGQREGAIERMRATSLQDDLDSEMIMIMIPMMENMGMMKEAGELRVKTLEMSATDPIVAEKRIKQLWENAELDKALQEARSADDTFGETSDFAKLSACLAAINSRTEWSPKEYVDPWLEKSLQVDSTGEVNDRKLAEALIAFKADPKESSAKLRQSLALFQNDDPTFQMISYMLGKSLEAEGDLFGAIAIYDQMDAQRKTYMSGMTLAIANYRAQNFERGINQMEQVLRKKSTVRGMYLYARMLLEGDEKFIYGLKAKRMNLIRLIERFIETPGEGNVVAASSLVPTFTMIALQMQDSARVEKALDWLMAEKNIPMDTLVQMARIKAGTEADQQQLMELIESRTDDADAIMMLRLEIQDDGAVSKESYEALAENIRTMDASNDDYEEMYVRLLGQLTRLDVENEFKLLEFERILPLIPESVSASRLIATFPEIWSDDPETAEIALQNITRITGENSPASVTVKVIKAINLTELDFSERAELIIQLDDVIKKSPGSIEALVLMSSLLKRGEQPDLESAANYLRRAIDLRPGLSSLYPSLIDLLKRTGNGSLALEYVNEYKNARILTLRESRTKAGVLAGEGEYRSALEELESLTTKSGENLDLLSLADFQAKRELYEDALVTFDQILSTDPKSTIAILGKSLTLGSIGQGDEAFEELAKIDGIEPGERFRYMALVSRAGDRPESELENISDMLEVDPDNVLNIIVAADTFQRMGMEEARSTALKRALELQPDNVEVLTMLADEVLRSDPGNRDLDDLFLKIERTKPNTARILRLIRDSSNVTSGDLEPTLKQVNESAEIADNLVNMYEAQSLAWNMHNARGLNEDAYKIALRAFINHPTKTDPIEWATLSALRSRMYQEAVDIREIGMDRVSSKKRLGYTLEFSDLCMQLGFETRAYSLLRPLQELAADEFELNALTRGGENDRINPQLIRETLLRVMLGSSRSGEAAELFGPLMENEEELFITWIKATKRLQNNDARKALQVIRPYLGGMANLMNYTEELSMLAQRSEQIEDLEDLRKAISSLEKMIDSNDTETQCRLLIVKSSLRKMEGDISGAIEYLDLVNDLVAGREGESESMRSLYCVALNNKALFQCQLDPADTDAALVNIDRAVLEGPDALLPSIYESLSTILKKRGECTLSIEALAKAAELTKNVDQKTNFNVSLVELMYECGKVEKAVENSRVLQEYIYNNPRPDITLLNRLDVLIDKGASR